MRESELLQRIYQRSAPIAESQGVLKGPGDDAAVLSPAVTGAPLLVTVDQLIEGRHFRGPLIGDNCSKIARKAVARSISDIAAMAGRPLWSLATAAFPEDVDQATANELARQLHEWGTRFRCPIVGGDIATLPANAPLVLTVTTIGQAVAVRGPVLRSGAMVGDVVMVTGRIGGSFESERHFTFEPRVAEAIAIAELLGGRLHAMIDVSDGLGRDAARIAEASQVRIVLDAGQVPWHRERAESTLHARGASDGEDYELLMALDANVDIREVRSALDRAGLTTLVTPMGRALSGRGCALRLVDGREIDASALGWDHGSIAPP